MPSSRNAVLPIKRQQLDMQPLRTLGEHTVRIRLTMDLIPEIKVTVYREGEAEPSLPIEEPAAKAEEKKPAKSCSQKRLPKPPHPPRPDLSKPSNNLPSPVQPAGEAGDVSLL